MNDFVRSVLQFTKIRAYGMLIEYTTKEYWHFNQMRCSLINLGYVDLCSNRKLSNASKQLFIGLDYVIICDIYLCNRNIFIHKTQLATLDLLCFDKSNLFEKIVHEKYLEYFNIKE